MGVPYIKVDPKKVLCVVETWRDDEVGGFAPTDEVTDKIGQNVANFLANEIKSGRIPKEFLPIQSNVGISGLVPNEAITALAILPTPD
jgi:acyl-CoA hydrolase